MPVPSEFYDSGSQTISVPAQPSSGGGYGMAYFAVGPNYQPVGTRYLLNVSASSNNSVGYYMQWSLDGTNWFVPQDTIFSSFSGNTAYPPVVTLSNPLPVSFYWVRMVFINSSSSAASITFSLQLCAS